MARPREVKVNVVGREQQHISQEKLQNTSDLGRPIVVVRIREEKNLAGLHSNVDFREAVGFWSVVLRSRRHWAGGVETRRQQASRARDQLAKFGLDENRLDRIARAGHVEISINHSGGVGESYARHVPWEYLLSAATADRRKGASLVVTRHLANMPRRQMRSPNNLLIIESAPGRLRRFFDFSSERRIVAGAFDFPDAQVQVAETETEEQLRKRFKNDSPDIVHFTGMDAHQHAELMGADQEDNSLMDGVVLRGPVNQAVIVEASKFANDLKGGTRPPVLVAFNCYHSSANLAAYAVREGAEAAIGFQDEINDETIEFFFGVFYREWRLNSWNIHKAFRAAWDSLRGNFAYLYGTGIVLWTAKSAFEPAKFQHFPQIRTKVVKNQLNAPRDQMLVDPRFLPEINYSLLHNEQPIFKSFLITRVKDGPSLPVEVTVELNVGMDSYPFRATETLGHEPLRLTDKVKIPLTSSLARSLRERVQSTLYLRVAVREEVVYQQTERVTLLPVDEWYDDVQGASQKNLNDRRSVWLPSFVLPRDPSVARIIDSSQRYLMALQDDPSAGFDGYQQVDQQNPVTLSSVDRQVMAIWFALSYEADLSYINPPPSYSLRTQRLRTPSDVIDAKRGTCIDLALLLAACLEYIDIYPTLILLRGHALPAYWRSNEAHERFVLAGPPGQSVSTSIPPGVMASSNSGSSRYGWVFDTRKFSELMRFIQEGDLVPLETVWLTNHRSFKAAKDAGRQKLQNPGEFDSMLDIIQARRNQPSVTPLPIIPRET